VITSKPSVRGQTTISSIEKPLRVVMSILDLADWVVAHPFTGEIKFLYKSVSQGRGILLLKSFLHKGVAAENLLLANRNIREHFQHKSSIDSILQGVGKPVKSLKRIPASH